MTFRSDQPSELQRLAELQRMCREVQSKHKAGMTPRGRKRRKVSRGTQRGLI
jgi:hypothetical protein